MRFVGAGGSQVLPSWFPGWYTGNNAGAAQRALDSCDSRCALLLTRGTSLERVSSSRRALQLWLILLWDPALALPCVPAAALSLH